MIQPPLNFSVTPASIAADAERLVRESKHRRDELVRNIAPKQATFANVMLPLAQMQDDFALEANVLGFYRDVSANADIRTASAKAQTLFDNFHTECWMREDLFKLVDVVYHNTEKISEESSMFLETVYAKFTQSGMGIQDTVSRERFKEIQGRLSQLNEEYRENLNSQTDEIFMTLAELDGIPEFLVKQLKDNSSNDKLRIDLSNPVHGGVLWFAEKSETRKKNVFSHAKQMQGQCTHCSRSCATQVSKGKAAGIRQLCRLSITIKDGQDSRPRE